MLHLDATVHFVSAGSSKYLLRAHW